MITDRVNKPYISTGLYAMTLEEIAAATGMSRQNVSMAIQNGLRKLARNPVVLRNLLELSALRQQQLATKNSFDMEAE